MIFEDQLAALIADSRNQGTRGGEIDFALLVDGLSAEREQPITIDVAYRFFSTERRKFIVADTPGHEQYTRNMITGASTADLAVILIASAPALSIQSSYLACDFFEMATESRKTGAVDIRCATITLTRVSFVIRPPVETATAVPRDARRKSRESRRVIVDPAQKSSKKRIKIGGALHDV